MRTKFYQYLKTTNTWTLVGIVIVLAVILTTSLNLIFARIGWGDQITPAILGIAMIDAFVTAALISPLIIIMLKRAAQLEEINRQLEQEVTDQRQAEQAAVQRAANLTLINEMALACAAIDAEADLPQMIANKLHTLTRAVAVAITTYDAQKQTLVVQHVSVSGKILSAFKKVWGHNIVGVSRPLKPEMKQRMLRDVVFVTPDVTETTLGLIPRPIAVALQKTLGVGGFTGLALIYNGELWGTAAIILRADQSPFEREVVLALSHIIAITMHRQAAEKALRVSEERFRSLLDKASNIAVQGYRPDGTVCYWNKASEQIYGYTAAEAMGQNLVDIIIPPDMRDEVRAAIKQMFETGESHPPEELWLMRKDGSLTPVYSNHTVIDIPRRGKELFCIDIDLTERKRAEEAQAQLEEQLRQAQKMETVGRLAGGVAHDFNNMLTAILGFAELLLSRFDVDEGAHKYVEQIRNAAERAASLTNQLLAFSRKQMLQPKLFKLNTLVVNIEKMLHRLIGEDIELVILLDPHLGQVEADPAQIDQVLMNLAVNARDAMPHGGKLTIETKNVYLDEAYVRQHMEVKPGPYVMLAVTDTGIGMDKETQTHIFEPFFTTKEVGKGTGLGLATIYGIIKQSDGHIWVYSEVGQGTTFKIYLPRLEKTTQTETQPTPTAAFQRGDETILLVEDTDIVSNLVENILTESGYTVLMANNGAEALQLCREHNGPIHLLLTDVVMPGMSGHELAEQITRLRPEIKTLYMSGYTDNAIVHHGLLEPGIAFLQKPFSPTTLTHQLREVLDTAG
jgi:PAS domain S-box-containing protein